MSEARRLILASASSARRGMLRAAGVDCEIVPAEIDEARITQELVAANTAVAAGDVAAVLACEKARSVSGAAPDAWVIGADQVLALGRHFVVKAATREEARKTLQTLRGETHELVSAVALAKAGTVIWQGVDRARLTMRDFSEAFLDDYLARAGAQVLGAVGCYELEGLGAQLFENIDGDYFTILGMPLLPLLAELRERGVIVR